MPILPQSMRRKAGRSSILSKSRRNLINLWRSTGFKAPKPLTRLRVSARRIQGLNSFYATRPLRVHATRKKLSRCPQYYSRELRIYPRYGKLYLTITQNFVQPFRKKYRRQIKNVQNYIYAVDADGKECTMIFTPLSPLRNTYGR